MTEAEIIRALTDLPGVVVQTASEDNGAPEVAWGDSFFFYDPHGTGGENQRFPFATIVTKDYPGFDTDSALDRPGVFRLNISVGRDAFARLFGFSPGQVAEHRAEFDFTALDRVLPHPVYAPQAWVSILVPGPDSETHVRSLIVHAYERAKTRHRPDREAPES